MDERLTYRQAAEFLGLHERTVRNLARDGKIKRYLAPVGRGHGGQRAYFLKSELANLKARMLPEKAKP